MSDDLKKEFEKKTGRIEPGYNVYDNVEYEQWQDEFISWLKNEVIKLRNNNKPKFNFKHPVIQHTPEMKKLHRDIETKSEQLSKMVAYAIDDCLIQYFGTDDLVEITNKIGSGFYSLNHFADGRTEFKMNGHRIFSVYTKYQDTKIQVIQEWG